MDKNDNFTMGTSAVRAEDNVAVVVMSSAMDPENVLEVRMPLDAARLLIAQLERALNAHKYYTPTQ
ncbi:MAG: hypothetical protein AB7F41_05905 [Methylocystis sp.]|uniref:hypothetical protein n=1 Tax=Methylocystis sp. TaxID=1911079 RepID=UPI003D13D09D